MPGIGPSFPDRSEPAYRTTSASHDARCNAPGTYVLPLEGHRSPSPRGHVHRPAIPVRLLARRETIHLTIAWTLNSTDARDTDATENDDKQARTANIAIATSAPRSDEHKPSLRLGPS